MRFSRSGSRTSSPGRWARHTRTGLASRRASGGLNYGRGTVAVSLTIAIVAWVGFLWVTKVDVERVQGAPRGLIKPRPFGRSLMAVVEESGYG